MSCSVSETSSAATLLVFLHSKLKHLNCPLDLHHLVGAIISAMQFYKAWTAFIASEVNVLSTFHNGNELLGV
jgi:hypothetical protein